MKRRALFVSFGLSSLLAAGWLSAQSTDPGAVAQADVDPRTAALAARPNTTPPATAAATVATPAQATAPANTDVGSMLAQLQRQEAATRKHLDELAIESRHAEQRTIARGRAYAKLARAGLLPVGGGLEAVVDHAAKLERLRMALERDLKLERKLVARRKELSKQLVDIQSRRAPLEAQARAMAMSRAALLAQRDRSLAYLRAFGGGDHTTVYGADPAVAALSTPEPAAEAAASTSSDLPATGFAALKGKLPFPIPGRVEVKSAKRSSGGPGVELLAPAGTEVRSMFKGRVAFADQYTDYGRTVILDHGDRFYTVSANLGSIEVAVGDELAAGARIGTVGTAKGGARVFVEIKRGTTILEPSEWFGL